MKIKKIFLSILVFCLVGCSVVKRDIKPGKIDLGDTVICDNDIASITVHYVDIKNNKGHITPIYHITIHNRSGYNLVDKNCGARIPANEVLTLDHADAYIEENDQFQLLFELYSGDTEILNVYTAYSDEGETVIEVNIH